MVLGSLIQAQTKINRFANDNNYKGETRNNEYDFHLHYFLSVEEAEV